MSENLPIDKLTRAEVANIVYHIAANTQTSKEYTREFMEQVLLRASEMLSMDSIGYPTINPFELNVSEYSGVNGDILDECAEELHDFPVNLCSWHKECNHPTDPNICEINTAVTCYCCEDGRKYCKSKQSHH